MAGLHSTGMAAAFLKSVSQSTTGKKFLRKLSTSWSGDLPLRVERRMCVQSRVIAHVFDVLKADDVDDVGDDVEDVAGISVVDDSVVAVAIVWCVF